MADTDKTPPPPGYRVNYAGEGEWKITVQGFGNPIYFTATAFSLMVAPVIFYLQASRQPVTGG